MYPRSAPPKSASVRSAPPRSDPVRFACASAAPLRFAPPRYAPRSSGTLQARACQPGTAQIGAHQAPTGFFPISPDSTRNCTASFPLRPPSKTLNTPSVRVRAILRTSSPGGDLRRFLSRTRPVRNRSRTPGGLALSIGFQPLRALSSRISVQQPATDREHDRDDEQDRPVPQGLLPGQTSHRCGSCQTRFNRLCNHAVSSHHHHARNHRNCGPDSCFQIHSQSPLMFPSAPPPPRIHSRQPPQRPLPKDPCRPCTAQPPAASLAASPHPPRLRALASFFVPSSATYCRPLNTTKGARRYPGPLRNETCYDGALILLNAPPPAATMKLSPLS